MIEPERLRAVQWRDLVHLDRLEVARELTLSLRWLLGSWLAAARGWYPLALACSFLFFLTGLRQVHNGHHYALGVSRAATEWVLFALSLLMLGSMHAVQVNHLRHHRHCLRADDVEAMSARMPGWRAILVGRCSRCACTAPPSRWRARASGAGSGPSWRAISS